MARKPKPVKIDPKQIGGIKRLRHLLPLLRTLHDDGCERDSAGNRELHFDEYVTLEKRKRGETEKGTSIFNLDAADFGG